MWHWIRGNAEPLEAVGILLTALVAVIALVGVKLQIDENDRLQREQSARETYREFLKLGIERPNLANNDWCRIEDNNARTAYEHYVEYALYTAEQVLAVDAAWQAPMVQALRPHSSYLCSKRDWENYSASVQTLADGLGCVAISGCQ
jgi:hypothetical protein